MPTAHPNRGRRDCPILCLLSNSSFFRSIMNFAHLFSASGISSLPPYVIITILGAGEAESFAPAYSTTQHSKAIHPNSGPRKNKTKRFYHFLARRLHPTIRRSLPIGKRRLLTKRSCTKLFALRILLGCPNAFSACVTVSPDL